MCSGVGCGIGPAPTALTSTILLIRPVPTVILSVTFPPVGDAVTILTAELKVAGTVWGFRGVFCRDQTNHQSFPLHLHECKAVPTYLPKGCVQGGLLYSPEEYKASLHGPKEGQIPSANSTAPHLLKPKLSYFSDLLWYPEKGHTEF